MAKEISSICKGLSFLHYDVNIAQSDNSINCKNSHYEFIGKKNCHQRSELAGWVTCIDTDPTSGLNNNEKKQVQDMKLLSPSLN